MIFLHGTSEVDSVVLFMVLGSLFLKYYHIDYMFLQMCSTYSNPPPSYMLTNTYKYFNAINVSSIFIKNHTKRVRHVKQTDEIFGRPHSFMYFIVCIFFHFAFGLVLCIFVDFLCVRGPLYNVEAAVMFNYNIMIMGFTQK